MKDNDLFEKIENSDPEIRQRKDVAREKLIRATGCKFVHREKGERTFKLLSSFACVIVALCFIIPIAIFVGKTDRKELNASSSNNSSGSEINSSISTSNQLGVPSDSDDFAGNSVSESTSNSKSSSIVSSISKSDSLSTNSSSHTSNSLSTNSSLHTSNSLSTNSSLHTSNSSTNSSSSTGSVSTDSTSTEKTYVFNDLIKMSNMWSSFQSVASTQKQEGSDKFLLYTTYTSSGITLYYDNSDAKNVIAYRENVHNSLDEICITAVPENITLDIIDEFVDSYSVNSGMVGDVKVAYNDAFNKCQFVSNGYSYLIELEYNSDTDFSSIRDVVENMLSSRTK